jgi:hypothetical protein
MVESRSQRSRKPYDLEINFGDTEGFIDNVLTFNGHKTGTDSGIAMRLMVGNAFDFYWGDNVDKTVEPNKYDSYTTLLHEFGHVVGLAHFGTFDKGYIMTDDRQTTRGGARGILHTIDADAIHGVRDLYAIAVPEPSTLMLLTIAGALFTAASRLAYAGLNDD